MYFKINSFLIVSCLTVFVAAEVQKTQLTFMYETYCPNSIKAFTKQFYPAYVNSFKDFLNITLNPFGNATKSNVNGYYFSCEHGEKECYSNKIHACVLNSTMVTKENQLKFVNCTLSTVDITSTNMTEYPTEMCAKIANIDLNEINNCLNSEKANITLYNFGLEMDHYTKLDIPSYVLNNQYNETLSQNLVNDFAKTYCNLRASMNETMLEACKHSNNSASVATLTVLPVVIFAFFFSKLYQ